MKEEVKLLLEKAWQEHRGKLVGTSLGLLLGIFVLIFGFWHMVPKDENELRQMLYTALQLDGPAAIRYPRGTGLGVELDSGFAALPVGKAEVLTRHGRIALLAVGSMGVLAALAKIKQNLDSLSRFDTSLDEVRKMVEDASCQLQEASYEVRDYGESLAFEPQRLDQMQSRMDVIYRLRKKYGATLADVQLHHQKVKEELAAIENYDEDIVELKKTIAADYQEARDAAAVLTEQRQRAARDISREIEEQLLALGMPNARFRLELSALPELTANGAEQLAMRLQEL